LAQAYIETAVPAHLRGKTQEKTLQARLSEDISRLREQSIFFRTNRARFFLRTFIGDPSIPNAFKTEFLARPRRKDLRNERILIFSEMRMGDERVRFLSRQDLDRVFHRQAYRYALWSELAADRSAVPVYSFVLFHTDREILTHFAGQFNEDKHPSKGFRTIGLGSVVRAQDSDLLYDAYYGIIGSGISELVYSLGLPRELAREARYEAKVRLHCALAGFDERVGPHLRAVMSYRCPDDFRPSKVSLSLNRLAWMKPSLSAPIPEFDEASQKLLTSPRLFSILKSQ
jgi:hypothetical protein